MDEMPRSGQLAARTAPGARGAGWVGDGFRYFGRDWLAWVAISFLLTLASMVQIVPLIGTLLVFLFSPVVMGGLMKALADGERGRRLEITDMFAAFGTPAFGALLRIGLFSLLLNVAAVAVSLVFVDLVAVMDFLSRVAQNTDMLQAANNLTFALGLFTGVMIYILLLVPIVMLVWFAPALVVLEGESTLTAMRHSFVGCMRNMIPFLVYGLVGLVVFPIVVLLPLIIGLLLDGPSLAMLMLLLVPGGLVLLPVGLASIYSAYRDIFHRA